MRTFLNHVLEGINKPEKPTFKEALRENIKLRKAVGGIVEFSRLSKKEQDAKAICDLYNNMEVVKKSGYSLKEMTELYKKANSRL